MVTFCLIPNLFLNMLAGVLHADIFVKLFVLLGLLSGEIFSTYCLV